MANERTYAILPCQELDESISFYETLGFKRTYRQVRPNPSAVVALEDIHIHLAGIDGFNPADSYLMFRLFWRSASRALRAPVLALCGSSVGPRS